jgi:hypothetical protein
MSETKCDSNSNGSVSDDADYCSEEENVPVDVDVLLVRTPTPLVCESGGFNVAYGAVGCLFALSTVVGVTMDDEGRLSSRMSHVISRKAAASNSKFIEKAMKIWNSNQPINDRNMTLLMNYGCSVSSEIQGCFHIADFSSVGTQMKYAPFIAWLLTKGWTQEQIFAKRITYKDERGFDRHTESDAVRMMKETFHAVIKYQRREGSRKVTLFNDICSAYMLSSTGVSFIKDWVYLTEGLYIEIKMFARMAIAIREAMDTGDSVGADFIHSRIAQSCITGRGSPMCQYDALILNPVGGDFSVAPDLGGYKITYSDDLVLNKADDFGDDLVSNSPRRGIGRQKLTIWTKNPNDAYAFLESPPIEGYDTAMHMNDAVGVPHVRLYPRDTVRVWISDKEQKSLSLQCVDVWIATISRFWSMHILHGRNDDVIYLTGIDSSMPRPYAHVQRQVPDVKEVTYALTIFFMLTYNMSVPGDLRDLWDEYASEQQKLEHKHVWWFFCERRISIRELTSYRYIANIRERAIQKNVTPISRSLHERLKLTRDRTKFFGYAVVELDNGITDMMRIQKRRNLHWLSVDMTTMDVTKTEIDDVMDRLDCVVPQPKHVYIRCKIDDLVFFDASMFRNFKVIVYPLYKQTTVGVTKLEINWGFLQHALRHGCSCVFEHPFINFVSDELPAIVLTPEVISEE